MIFHRVKSHRYTYQLICYILFGRAVYNNNVQVSPIVRLSVPIYVSILVGVLDLFVNQRYWSRFAVNLKIKKYRLGKVIHLFKELPSIHVIPNEIMWDNMACAMNVIKIPTYTYSLYVLWYLYWVILFVRKKPSIFHLLYEHHPS